MAKCCIPGCENEMQCPSTGTCKNCYSNILSWSKRSAEDILNRQKRIGLFANRMQTISHNVSIMTPKKLKLKAIPGQVKSPPIKINSKKRKII